MYSVLYPELIVVCDFEILDWFYNVVKVERNISSLTVYHLEESGFLSSDTYPLDCLVYSIKSV